MNEQDTLYNRNRNNNNNNNNSSSSILFWNDVCGHMIPKYMDE
jgi:hypothetical protein